MRKLIPNQMLELQNLGIPGQHTTYTPQATEQQVYNTYQSRPLQTLKPEDLASQEWYRQNRPIDEMETITGLMETVDYLTGAPVRAALGSALGEGDKPFDAFKAGLSQFGRHPRTAPTGSQLAEQMGVSTTPLSKLAEASGYAGHPTQAKLSDMVGLGIEATADVTPLMGMMLPASKVFHGSPHKFDKFDLSKIGTGEGAQAFGHGLYVTDNPKIAEGYAKTLGEGNIGAISPKAGREIEKMYTHGMSDHLIETLKRTGYNKDETVKQMREFSKMATDPEKANAFNKYADLIESEDIELTSANNLFYTSKIPEGEYLVWDKPVTKEEIQIIRDEVNKLSPNNSLRSEIIMNLKSAEENIGTPLEWDGKKLYNQISFAYGNNDKLTSRILNKAGFKGTQYPAGTLSGVTNSKAKNYVLFSDKDLPISEIKNLSTGELQKLGKSKYLIDDSGKEMILYHGAKDNPNYKGTKSGGTYLSDDPNVSELFTDPNAPPSKINEYKVKYENKFDARWEKMNDSQKKELKEVVNSVVDEDYTREIREEIGDPDWDAFESFTDGDFYQYAGRSPQDAIHDELFKKGYDLVIFPDDVSAGAGTTSYVVKNPKKQLIK